jgi:hypothetical protein
MSSSRISEVTAEALQAAGWDPVRKIDVTKYEKALEVEGYPRVPAALDFLGSFGGLEIVHPNPRAKGSMKRIVLDPERAIAQFDFGWAREYMDRLGQSLSAIGTAASGYLLLLMNEDGAVYAGFDDLLYFVGRDALEALDNLCCGREYPEVGGH